MKKFVVLLALICTTLVFGVTLTPSYFMNSDGDMVAEVNLVVDTEAIGLEFDTMYDLVSAECDTNAVLTLDGDSGLYMLGVGYNTVVATPSIAFMYVLPRIGNEAIGLELVLGTGDFTDTDFGKKLIGDFWANNRDLSIKSRFGTSFILDSFKLDSGVNLGYYLMDSSYNVSIDLGTKLFDVVYFDAKAVILPAFSWEFRLKAVFVF